MERFTAAAVTVKDEPVIMAPSDPTVNEAKLASLAQSAPVVPTIPEKPAEPVKRADLSKANEKLSSLLGGKKP